MSGKLAKHAYEQLVREDLEWLDKQPRTLERDHVEVIVKNSVEMHYPPDREGRVGHEFEECFCGQVRSDGHYDVCHRTGCALPRSAHRTLPPDSDPVWARQIDGTWPSAHTGGEAPTDCCSGFRPGTSGAICSTCGGTCDEHEPAPQGGGGEQWLVRVLQRVAELPDRTSPEDWPDAMLVTHAELEHILRDELSDTSRDSQLAEKDARIAALQAAGDAYAAYVREQLATQSAEIERLKAVRPAALSMLDEILALPHIEQPGAGENVAGVVNDALTELADRAESAERERDALRSALADL